MRTVLIYRLGSLGDTVLCLPCLHRVAERFPDSKRIVITNKPVSPSAPGVWDVLAGSDLVHGTIDYPLGTRSPLELGRLWLELRALTPGNARLSHGGARQEHRLARYQVLSIVWHFRDHRSACHRRTAIE